MRIQIDLDQPETLVELAARLIDELIQLGDDLEQAVIRRDSLRYKLDLLKLKQGMVEEEEWTALRQEALETGAPKDPLTGRSNQAYSEAVIRQRLKADPAWVALEGEIQETLAVQAERETAYAAGRARLDALVSAADLLRGLLGKVT